MKPIVQLQSNEYGMAYMATLTLVSSKAQKDLTIDQRLIHKKIQQHKINKLDDQRLISKLGSQIKSPFKKFQ